MSYSPPGARFNRPKCRRAGIAIATGLYMLALSLPVFENDSRIARGWEFVLPFGIPGSGYLLMLPPWWANLVFLMGLICLARGAGRAAFWCGVAALALVSTILIYVDGVRFTPLPAQLIWVSAMIVLTVSGWWGGESTTSRRSPAHYPRPGDGPNPFGISPEA